MTGLGHSEGASFSLEGIDFSYGSLQVLFNVDLTVRSGEIIALLGTNGAGKSTLLRVLAGLVRPANGRVLLDGEDITRRPVEERVAASIALLVGGRATFPDMTVDENLEVGAFPLGRRPAVVAERIAAVLELFPDLSPLRRRRAGLLSGGERQQLALAKVLLVEPRVLCIDELSLGLSPMVVDSLVGIVWDLHVRGTTIVLVEQSLNVAAALCQRCVFMEKGEIRFEGSPSELLERDDLARAVFFGGGREPIGAAP